MSKPRKYCGKQLIDRTKALTTKCFEASVDDVIAKLKIDMVKWNRIEIITDMRSGKLRALFGGDVHPDIELIKEEVDLLYLEKLCTLPTKAIEDIIWANDQKKFRRAPRTIEVLTSELTRRALMGDSSQSDSISNERGATNVRSTSKKHSKSTSRKKRKSLKNRRRD